MQFKEKFKEGWREKPRYNQGKGCCDEICAPVNMCPFTERTLYDSSVLYCLDHSIDAGDQFDETVAWLQAMALWISTGTRTGESLPVYQQLTNFN